MDKTKKTLKRVIWAVDPYVVSPDLQMRTAHALRALTKGLKVSIEPVYVISPQHLRVTTSSFGEFIQGETVEDLRKVESAPEKMIETLGMRAELPGLLPPKRLLHESYSLRGTAETLLKYAKHTDTDLIAVGTRAREGLGRFFFGSFAETLLLHSRIPLFTVNPSASPFNHFKHIIFATDCSPTSRKAFEQVLHVAKELKTKLTLFHKSEYLIEGTSTSRYNISDMRHLPIQAEIRKTEEKMAQWKTEAKTAAVEVDVVIDKDVGNVSEAVLHYAEKIDSPLLAMAPHSGELMTAMIGSATRQVVRHAHCPVWVVHPT